MICGILGRSVGQTFSPVDGGGGIFGRPIFGEVAHGGVLRGTGRHGGNDISRSGWCASCFSHISSAFSSAGVCVSAGNVCPRHRGGRILRGQRPRHGHRDGILQFPRRQFLRDVFRGGLRVRSRQQLQALLQHPVARAALQVLGGKINRALRVCVTASEMSTLSVAVARVRPRLPGSSPSRAPRSCPCCSNCRPPCVTHFPALHRLAPIAATRPPKPGRSSPVDPASRDRRSVARALPPCWPPAQRRVADRSCKNAGSAMSRPCVYSLPGGICCNHASAASGSC